MASTAASVHGELKCAWCEQQHDFEMPPALHKACERGDLVIFAGAGISTEQTAVVGRNTLYQQLIDELDLDDTENWTFPAVMSKYEEVHGRPPLLQRIKRHLDYVRSFPNLDRQAGRFHRELASLYTVTEIFTTNWDDYFERECGAQPFVTEEDWALWRPGERSVFKLHGSMSSPGSIVATTADYEECLENLNEGLNGARLKQMLATKAVVFVGYSLRDPDLTALYEVLKNKMGKLMPRAYVVTTSAGDPPPVAKDMHVIKTSGAHFVHTLKAAYDEAELIPDERFEMLPFVRDLVSAVHHELVGKGEMRDDPAMFMSACYQDGLLDAFDHQMANAARGDYHHRCYVERIIDMYERLFEERVEDERFETAAYIDGYIQGQEFLLSNDEERKKLAVYFVANYDGEPLRTFEQYSAAAEHFAENAPDVYQYAKAAANRLAPGTVFQHMPSL